MAAYRIYCLDGANRVTRADNLEAFNDDDAVRKARVLAADAFKTALERSPRFAPTIKLVSELLLVAVVVLLALA